MVATVHVGVAVEAMMIRGQGGKGGWTGWTLLAEAPEEWVDGFSRRARD